MACYWVPILLVLGLGFAAASKTPPGAIYWSNSPVDGRGQQHRSHDLPARD